MYTQPSSKFKFLAFFIFVLMKNTFLNCTFSKLTFLKLQ